MRHLIFDTETTGLISNSLQPIDKQPRIMEFFGLILEGDDLDEAEEYHAYIDPGIPIPVKAARITGIQDSDLFGKPKFENIAGKVVALIQSADVVIAHNISYDMSVIDFELARIDRAVKWPEKRICTVEATESLKGHRLNLQGLHSELFGENFDDAHSAINDVRATARCYKELIKRGEV
jgi:DNA polymerase-3 subunit epsilon